jgi:hypothetical protein
MSEIIISNKGNSDHKKRGSELDSLPLLIFQYCNRTFNGGALDLSFIKTIDYKEAANSLASLIQRFASNSPANSAPPTR